MSELTRRRLIAGSSGIGAVLLLAAHDVIYPPRKTSAVKGEHNAVRDNGWLITQSTHNLVRQHPELKDFIQHLRQSVGIVWTQRGNEYDFRGSGFIVGSNGSRLTIITDRHVTLDHHGITKLNELNVTFLPPGSPKPICAVASNVRRAKNCDAASITAEILPQYHKDADIYLRTLALDGTARSDDALTMGSYIYIEKYRKEGLVFDAKRIRNPKPENGLRRYEGAGDHGGSGGPGIDLDGNVQAMLINVYGDCLPAGEIITSLREAEATAPERKAAHPIAAAVTQGFELKN